MKIQIERLSDNTIGTVVDTRDVKDSGELSHIICQLEVIKQQLLHRWNDKKG